MKSASIFRSVATLVILLGCTPAFALSNFTPSDLSSLTDSAVNDLIKTVAVGANHRAYLPARALGVIGGVDFGLDVTAIVTPQSFIDAISTATGQASTSVPALIPVPKLSFHKGLPAGIDVGMSYSSYQDLFKAYGGDIKWAFIHGGIAAPSVAVRLSGSYNKLFFMSTHTYTFDVVASKNLYVIEPYVGTGLQFWSGDLLYSADIQGLAVDIPGHRSSTNPHIFFGLPIKLFVLKITGEIDYSFAKITTYGGKIALGF